MSGAASLALLVALGCGFAHLARAVKASATRLSHLSQSISVHASGRGNPWINFADGLDVLTSYSGAEALTLALQQNLAQPLALASADFDEDGVPDLICGYSHSSTGIITCMRGNVDSIYPNSPEAQRRKIAGEFTNAPFLSPARVFALPIEPEFLGAGDFDGDGHWDVVAASHGSDALYLLPGDGRGGLGAARRIALPGTVTALVTGEINRRDGLDDVVVAVDGRDGPKALVFEGPEGALRAKPEAFDLPAKASALALGQLDDDYPIDLAVAAGRELIIIHGRDRKLSLDEKSRAEVPQASISRRTLPFTVRSLAVGDFSGNHRTGVALLSEDGGVRFLVEERQEASEAGQRNMQELTTDHWPLTTALICARVSGSANDDLLLVDSASRQLHIVTGKPLDTGTVAESPILTEGILQREAISLDVEGEPAAVLPMRLNSDARRSLVVLNNGHGSPSVLLPQAAMPFTVINTNDDGANSLREAIVNANSNPGTDTIRFNIPGAGVHTIALASALPIITGPVIIDGTTQPGFAGAPVIELDGTKAPERAGLLIDTGGTTVRGLVINRFPQDGILIGNVENTVIEGNFIGTDASGTQSLGNGTLFGIGHGVVAVGPNANGTGARNNIIGGTTPSARNIISGNRGHGVLMSGVHNQVQGNFIGTNVNGTLEIRNSASGVVSASGVNNEIGGTTRGTRNIISGNQVSGVFVDSAVANLVQGNFIGTDVSGSTIVSNGAYGVLLTGTNTSNTIGATVIGARNVISGNGQVGVAIYFPGSRNLVQGNLIGTDADGTSGLGNGHEGYVSTSSDNIVGGSTVLARNIISGNGSRSVVEMVHYPGVTIVSATGNQVQNNYIGTDLTGTIPIGNDSVGVLVSGADSTMIKDNIISANGSHGVSLGGFATDPNTNEKRFGGAGATVDGNFIGTDPSGSQLGNGQDGVFVENQCQTHTIERNIIAFNQRSGVCIPNTASNLNIPAGAPAFQILISQNSIYSNTALGIDLGESGVTANHEENPARPEANHAQNFPDLTSVTSDGVSTTIQAKLEMKNKPKMTFTIEFFSNASTSSSRCVRQGQHLMLSIPATTDANGTAIINVVLPIAMAGGYINATATDPDNNTSEFSDCAQVGAARGPELIEISVTSNLVAVGSGFVKPVRVFIDGVGFPDDQSARVKGGGTRVIQKGKLTDGRSIAEAVPPGRVVKIRFLNGNGAETVVQFRK
jgi:hypothetical protein